MSSVSTWSIQAYFGEKTPGIAYPKREAVYALCVNKKSEVAVLKTPRGIFLPGGGIEAQEDYIACLVRECQEETGYAIANPIYIGSASLYDFAPSIKQHLEMVGHFYRVDFQAPNGIEIHQVKGQEADKTLQWLSFEDAIKSLKLPHQAWGVKVLKDSHF